MGIYKRTITSKGTYKNIVVHDGKFVDNETGDVIPVTEEIAKSIGEYVAFDMTVSQKSDEEI